MRKPRLSLVFPAFNEAENLPTLLESATKTGDQLGVDFEIVIVDDGSEDGSKAVLERWSVRDPRIRSVQHATNRGYGAALRAGLREARGDFVFFSDADLQFDLREIADLLFARLRLRLPRLALEDEAAAVPRRTVLRCPDALHVTRLD